MLSSRWLVLCYAFAGTLANALNLTLVHGYASLRRQELIEIQRDDMRGFFGSLVVAAAIAAMVLAIAALLSLLYRRVRGGEHTPRTTLIAFVTLACCSSLAANGLTLYVTDHAHSNTVFNPDNYYRIRDNFTIPITILAVANQILLLKAAWHVNDHGRENSSPIKPSPDRA